MIHDGSFKAERFVMKNSNLPWRIYRPGDHHAYEPPYVLMGRTAHAEDAAVLISSLPEGSVVKYGRRIVWREGSKGECAGESYDLAAEKMLQRIGEQKKPIHEEDDIHQFTRKMIQSLHTLSGNPSQSQDV